MEKRNVISFIWISKLNQRRNQYVVFMDKVIKIYLHLELVQWENKMKLDLNLLNDLLNLLGTYYRI